MYIETWYKMCCDKCKTINWFCDGDTTDCTAMGIEACECFKCGYCWWIDEENNMNALVDEDDEDHETPEERLKNYTDKGMEIPT